MLTSKLKPLGYAFVLCIRSNSTLICIHNYLDIRSQRFHGSNCPCFGRFIQVEKKLESSGFGWDRLRVLRWQVPSSIWSRPSHKMVGPGIISKTRKNRDVSATNWDKNKRIGKLYILESSGSRWVWSLLVTVQSNLGFIALPPTSQTIDDGIVKS